MTALLQEEDVGNILIKVQEDLYHLKERFLHDNQDGKVDIDELQKALSNAEHGLRIRTEELLTQMHHRVSSIDDHVDPLPSTKEAALSFVKGQFQQFTQNQRQLGVSDTKALTYQGDAYIPKSIVQHMSPGEQFKRSRSLRNLQNPQNQLTRQIANKKYGVELPSINVKVTTKNPTDRIVRGSNVDKLAILPRANRVDPQRIPPSITEEEARRGILSLLERGLIPPSTEITFDPPAVRNKTATIHQGFDTNLYFPADGTEPGFSLSGYLLDSDPVEAPLPRIHSPPLPIRARIEDTTPRSQDRLKKTGVRSAEHPASMRTANVGMDLPSTQQAVTAPTVPPPTTPASQISKHDSMHRFAIQNGKTRFNSTDYVAYKQHYCLVWGSIVTALKYLEQFLEKYAIPVAFVNGDRLADLSVEYEMETKPSERELLSCLVNKEAVESMMKQPGRQFKGPTGRDLAATKLQSHWRRYLVHKRYLESRRKKWAAGVIAIRWILYVKMASVKKHLKVTRQTQLDNYHARTKYLSDNWTKIKSSRHVIIHIPSLGYSQKIRDNMHDIGMLQNTQMARLCDLKDPNVDIIYISSVPVNDDLIQYYSKLLSLKPQLAPGQQESPRPAGERYKIIVPEAVKSFPTHNMCLASLLKYSPRALRRISHLIRGRRAYIVPGVPHLDDLAVADALEVPILCPEPQLAHLYSNKSGSKRIFSAANGVDMPPGELDVYSLDQLHESLAMLITKNLPVRRWLLKIDGEISGRGLAFVDVGDHLSCYRWALKERERYGEKWSKNWAHETAYMRILTEIPKVLLNHATPCNKKVYPSWQKFLSTFLSQGGVVEACPPSDSITNITVDLLIEPTGKVRIVSSGDQIHEATPLTSWGLSVPQSSIDPSILNSSCEKIGESCKQRKLLGFFSIDFVTFLDPDTNVQKLWATDLDISHSDTVALAQLAFFASNASFIPEDHSVMVPPKPVDPEQKRKRRIFPEDVKPENCNRFIAMSSHLYHTNLTVVHYSVFFQMCRAHGIGYDLKERQGTIFTLIDSFNRQNLCMIAIGNTLEGALETFGRNLWIIHQEISAPNMQGQSNFKPVIKEIEEIIGQAIENAEVVPESALGT